MIAYFANDTNKKKLAQVAESWTGTKYHHAGFTRHGTDCAKFIAQIFVDLGLLDKVDDVQYARDWYLHGGRDLIIESFLDHAERYITQGLEMQKLNYANKYLVLPGDIVCISKCTTGLCNHSGLLLGDGNFVHCIERRGVKIDPFSDYWRKDTKYLLRLVKHGN